MVATLYTVASGIFKPVILRLQSTEHTGTATLLHLICICKCGKWKPLVCRSIVIIHTTSVSSVSRLVSRRNRSVWLFRLYCCSDSNCWCDWWWSWWYNWWCNWWCNWCSRVWLHLHWMWTASRNFCSVEESQTAGTWWDSLMATLN